MRQQGKTQRAMAELAGQQNETSFGQSLKMAR